jgi:hypothetical protein
VRLVIPGDQEQVDLRLTPVQAMKWLPQAAFEEMKIPTLEQMLDLALTQTSMDSNGFVNLSEVYLMFREQCVPIMAAQNMIVKAKDEEMDAVAIFLPMVPDQPPHYRLAVESMITAVKSARLGLNVTQLPDWTQLSQLQPR